MAKLESGSLHPDGEPPLPAGARELELRRRRGVLLLWLILAATVAVHAAGSLWIGYLSDDHDLLAAARATPCLAPLEGHHFAPLPGLLFRLAAAGHFAPRAWHGLALAVHLVNTVLLFDLARRGLKLSAGLSLAAAALFAANPAGYEAVAWAAAIGYVLTLPFLLLALRLALQADRYPPGRCALGLAGLQLAALFCWDWGVVLFPQLVVLSVLRWRPNHRAEMSAAVHRLLPCAAVWVLVLAMKQMGGYQAGYFPALSRPFEAAGMLAAAPLTQLVPTIRLQALFTAPGLAAAGLGLACLGAAAWRDRAARLCGALYFTTLLPALFFGSLQSRYMYLASPFFVTAFAAGAGRIPSALGRWILLAALIVLHTAFAAQRSTWWAGAYREAERLRVAMAGLPCTGERELVIVNLPDRYGPDGLIWRPFVWRNGLVAFGRPFRRVNTPGAPFTWNGGPVPRQARDEVAVLNPEAVLYEVMYAAPGDWRRFALKRFE